MHGLLFEQVLFISFLKHLSIIFSILINLLSSPCMAVVHWVRRVKHMTAWPVHGREINQPRRKTRLARIERKLGRAQQHGLSHKDQSL